MFGLRSALARRTVIVSAIGVSFSAAAQGALVHRYSFNDGTANDSVGTANGTTMNGATISGGQLVLNNNGLSGSSVQYVNLPANVLPTSGGVTSIEEWFTSNNSGGWARGFDFGNGPGVNLFYTPVSGPNDSRAILNDGAGETGPTGAPTLNDNTQHMAAVVVSDAAQTISYYIDGTLFKSVPEGANTLAALNNTYNYLGRSQYNDPGLNGSINEVRIYDNALSANQISADYANGPDVVPEPAALSLVLAGGTLLLARRKRA